MNTPITLLPFDVRPFHRETLESYSDRLLAANFCDDTHRAMLTRTYSANHSAKAEREGWKHALTAVTKRSTLFLEPRKDGRYGCPTEHCQHFEDTLPTRFACTHCTHGAIVEQNPPLR